MYVVIGLNKETGALYCDSYGKDERSTRTRMVELARMHDLAPDSEQCFWVLDNSDWSFETPTHRYAISDTGMPY